MKQIQSVDWSLTTSLKSSNNLVETVAIRNVRVNQSDHQLMVDILIFPLGREGFTQTTLALVTFAFSNQDYKPPPIFGWKKFEVFKGGHYDSSSRCTKGFFPLGKP
ncbi:hypothetical protein F2Q70_00007256 [Brassica cretica]|uniref:Neprosin domain-containing protein n=1 Tax=Brassica cretica TaxID=69181 RepID=A0A8S9M2V5_BRACR|nr:hypothetical protein F2Q70_00007256 [Brassica cretica]